MKEQAYDDQMITQYLLGALPETETERIDELCFLDDDFDDCVQAVERDLVDAYVRGELTGPILAKFNAHYLASPRRRERVNFAHALRILTDQAVAEPRAALAGRAAASEPASRRRSLREFFAVPVWQWGFVSVSVLALAAGGGLVFEILRLRNQVDQSQQREKEFWAQIEQQRSANAEKEKQEKALREELARLEQQRAIEQRRAKLQPPALPPSLRTFSRELASASHRGIPGGNNQITIPPGTNYVTLLLDLPPNEFSTFCAELRLGPNEQIVRRFENLKASSKEMGRQIEVTIRADLLKSQEYLLKVTGISADRAPEELDDYKFIVKKQ